MLSCALKACDNKKLLNTNAEQVWLFKGVEVEKLNFNDLNEWNKEQPAYSIW